MKLRLSVASVAWSSTLCLLMLGCKSTLSQSFEGKRCGPMGECLLHYVCNDANFCVPEDALSRGLDAGLNTDWGSPDASTSPAVAQPVTQVVSGPDVVDATLAAASKEVSRCSACVEGEDCVEGACLSACPSSTTRCGTACVDTSTNQDHCGACDQACADVPNGQGICQQGRCETACDEGFERCGDTCVDLSHDPDNCGRCGYGCVVPTFGVATCAAKRCGIECREGFIDCDASCIDPATNPDHCGGCGVRCTDAEVCSNGACVGVCPTGTTASGSSCVHTATNVANCGSCGDVCPVTPNGAASCSGRKCVPPCAVPTPKRSGGHAPRG